MAKRTAEKMTSSTTRKRMFFRKRRSLTELNVAVTTLTPPIRVLPGPYREGLRVSHIGRRTNRVLLALEKKLSLPAHAAATQ